MTESEFLNYSDRLFAYLENQIDELDLDIDSQYAGNVLELEIEDSGDKIIINRHTPNQELWIASRTGGYHFSYQENRWIAQKDNKEFFEVLSEELSKALEEKLFIPPLLFSAN